MRPEVSKLATQQHGVISRGQLLDAGVPRTTIDNWARRRDLVRLHQGVFVLSGVPRTWEQRLMAAVLASGGLASHRSAARLWDLLRSDDTVEVLASRSVGSLVGVVIHRSAVTVEPSLRRGIKVTNPLDTLALLGAVTPRAVVEQAVHQAVVKRVVSVEGLAQAADRLAKPGRRGPAVLRAILSEWDLGQRPADSVLELEMAKIFRRGLPPPVFQHEVWNEGRLVGRIDFACPAAMIAIEVEGAEHHTHPLTRQRDLERRNRLTQLGWAVMVFTWYDVMRRPAWVAEQIRGQLAA